MLENRKETLELETQNQIELLQKELEVMRENYKQLSYASEQVVIEYKSHHAISDALSEKVSSLETVLKEQIRQCVGSVTDVEMQVTDELLIKKGMLPLSTILSNSPTSTFFKHVGVDDMFMFEQWLNMRVKETQRMKATLLLKGDSSSELFEWTLAFSASFNEVSVNFQNALQR